MVGYRDGSNSAGQRRGLITTPARVLMRKASCAEDKPPHLAFEYVAV